MFEEDFRKILIFTCIFGLLGILTIIYFYEISEVSISQLLAPKAKEGIYILSGNLKELETKSNTVFFKLCDSRDCIDGVYFNPSKALLDDLQVALHNNLVIEVKARFEYYYGSPEIIVYKFYLEDKEDYS